MKSQTFEEYLQDRHADQYYGTDDCMVDDMNDWIANLDVQEVIYFADAWGHIQYMSGFKKASEATPL